MTEADQDRQNAMRDRGYGDLEQRLWAIIDRDGLGDVPSDIVGAVARLAAIAAQVERDQAELARLREEVDQAQDLIDACADAQASGEPLPSAVDMATSVLVDAGAASIQRLCAPATPVPQQAEPRLRESVASESAIERVRALAVSVPGGPGYDNRLLAVFAIAITEAEQAAARAAWREAFAEATHAAIWKIHDAGLPANHRNLDIRTRLAGAVKTALDVLATKPPQQVPPPGAMERAREVVDRFPVPEEFDAKICLVEEVAAALEAARAEVIAKGLRLCRDRDFTAYINPGSAQACAENIADGLRVLAAKTPQPQKPKE